MGTGSYEATEVDLRIQTVGFPLFVARRYDSTHAVDGPLGYGWISSLTSRLYYAVYLFQAPDIYKKEADITMPDGKRYRFTQADNGTFTPPKGRFDVLLRNGDGSFDLTLQRTRSKLRFAPDGRITSMTDDYGNALNYTYDGAGRLQRVADAAGSGRYLDVFWGADGRISIVRDSASRQVQYFYNASGALTSVIDPANRTTFYAYNQGRFSPLLAQIKDNWNRVITDVTYDSTDRVRTYTEKGELYTYTYGYQGHPSVTAKTDTAGNSFLYPFAAGGLVSDTTPPSGGGGPTHTDYYPDGLVQQFTDAAGVKTYYTYNTQAEPLSITRDYQGPAAVRFDYAYDPVFPEKLVSITPRNASTNLAHPDWQAWRYDYYPIGAPAPGALHHVYRARADGNSFDVMATYVYDTRGRVTRSTSPTGASTDYVYDAQGNLATVTDPANNDAGARPVTAYGYDALGRVTSVTDPLNHLTIYAYDALDRVALVTLPKPALGSPLNFTTVYVYDQFDAVTALLFTHMTDPNGMLSRFGYDEHDQLVRLVDAQGNITRYSYARGLLASVTDAQGYATLYSYDSGRRLDRTVFADGSAETYQYHPDGLLWRRYDRRGLPVTYTYDRFKRVLSKEYSISPGGSVVFTYAGQKLASVTDTRFSPPDVHTYTYDSAYRVQTVTQGPRGAMTYTYNADDTVASYAVAGGPTATYSYYPDASLSTISWSPVAGQFKYRFTRTGQYESITLPNGQRRAFTYDDQSRVTQIANLSGSAANLATYVYGYDFNYATSTYNRLGQRTSMAATVPSQGLNNHLTRYEYDGLYQLTKVTYPAVAPFNGEVHSWTYDATGNRLTNTVGMTTQMYTYQKVGTNPNNWRRLLSDSVSSYTYDLNGNVLTRSGAPGNFNFTWDNDDRLNLVSGAESAQYASDHQGRRSGKTVGSATTSYLYDGLNLVRESGTTSADYLFGIGIDEILAVSRGSQVEYAVTDALGSVAAMTASTGSIRSSYLYDAWGVTRGQSGSPLSPLGFTAREVSEAGLLYYRARFYAPPLGRFLSEDPLGQYVQLHSREIYGYVANAPTMATDPTGLVCTTNITRGPKSPYKETWKMTDWMPAGTRLEGNEGGEPIYHPPVPAGMRQPRPRAAPGVFWTVQICDWVRYLMITIYWKRTLTVSVHCECPPRTAVTHEWEHGTEVRYGTPQRAQTTGMMAFGVMRACGRPAP